jgi:hypothetical protein
MFKRILSSRSGRLKHEPDHVRWDRATYNARVSGFRADLLKLLHHKLTATERHNRLAPELVRELDWVIESPTDRTLYGPAERRVDYKLVDAKEMDLDVIEAGGDVSTMVPAPPGCRSCLLSLAQSLIL